MSAAEFAYLDARVNLYARQLLELDQINSLIERTPGEDAVELSQPGALLQDTDDLDQHNVNILLGELAVLVRPLSGAPRALLGYWAQRFELGNLKTIIRGKMANQPRPLIEARLQDMAASPACPSTSCCKATRLRNCCVVWNGRPTRRWRAGRGVSWNEAKRCSRSTPRWIAAISRVWRD